MPETKPKPNLAPPPDAGHIPMSEELDRARWTLPPILPVLAAAAIVAIALAIFTYHTTRPAVRGKILGVYAVEQASGSSVLVNVQLSMKNVSKKPFWIQNIKVVVTPPADAADKGAWEDDAAPGVDLARYFQAYPELAQHKMDPLGDNTKILPGESRDGMVVVGFPVGKAVFDKKQALKVVVQPYDQAAITLQQ